MSGLPPNCVVCSVGVDSTDGQCFGCHHFAHFACSHAIEEASSWTAASNICPVCSGPQPRVPSAHVSQPMPHPTNNRNPIQPNPAVADGLRAGQFNHNLMMPPAGGAVFRLPSALANTIPGAAGGARTVPPPPPAPRHGVVVAPPVADPGTTATASNPHASVAPPARARTDSCTIPDTSRPSCRFDRHAICSNCCRIRCRQCC
mmetsp:Transcript_51810/g.110040  ORF Transcript_51810/g.110040 Transcript_51810/m.110040 type:complete len:203 (+) Transcript_51810:67-675(+)